MDRIRAFDASHARNTCGAISARRRKAVLAAVGILLLVALGAALTLDGRAGTSGLVDGDSKAARATADLHRGFGDEPIVVLVRGKLTGVLLTEDLGRLLRLEGCISGNLPRGASPPAPVCARFARRKPVRVVYGPATFVNEAAGQVLDRVLGLRGRRNAEAARAMRAARKVAEAQGLDSARSSSRPAVRVAWCTRSTPQTRRSWRSHTGSTVHPR